MAVAVAVAGLFDECNCSGEDKQSAAVVKQHQQPATNNHWDKKYKENTTLSATVCAMLITGHDGSTTLLESGASSDPHPRPPSMWTKGANVYAHSPASGFRLRLAVAVAVAVALALAFAFA